MRKFLRETSDPLSFTFDISADADLSDAIDISAYSFGMLYLPSNFDGTDLKFHTAPSKDSTYQIVVDGTDGSDLTVVAAASKNVAIPPEAMAGAWLKLESVTDQATDDTVIPATFTS